MIYNRVLYTFHSSFSTCKVTGGKVREKEASSVQSREWRDDWMKRERKAEIKNLLASVRLATPTLQPSSEINQ